MPPEPDTRSFTNPNLQEFHSLLFGSGLRPCDGGIPDPDIIFRINSILSNPDQLRGLGGAIHTTWNMLMPSIEESGSTLVDSYGKVTNYGIDQQIERFEGKYVGDLGLLLELYIMAKFIENPKVLMVGDDDFPPTFSEEACNMFQHSARLKAAITGFTQAYQRRLISDSKHSSINELTGPVGLVGGIFAGIIGKNILSEYGLHISPFVGFSALAIASIMAYSARGISKHVGSLFERFEKTGKPNPNIGLGNVDESTKDIIYKFLLVSQNISPAEIRTYIQELQKLITIQGSEYNSASMSVETGLSVAIGISLFKEVERWLSAMSVYDTTSSNVPGEFTNAFYLVLVALATLGGNFIAGAIE